MFTKIGLYYRTIKHLKPIQIRYRLWYVIRNSFRGLTGYSYRDLNAPDTQNLILKDGLIKPESYSNDTFSFLNQSKEFKRSINWNFIEYGKLWTYNLNYFDYLHQENMNAETGLGLIKDFIGQGKNIYTGMEPYPISLRTINWIKFLSRHDISEPQIDRSLYRQYDILLDNIEYHVLGNHLLENGCSLLFGCFYFKEKELWQKSREIIAGQLEEQILKDGGHYEKSVMYHCIILERLIDCFNLLQHQQLFIEQGDLAGLIRNKVSDMLGWLENMQWEGGDLPEVNDYIPEMTPEVDEIIDYAARMDITYNKKELGDSGYRKYKKEGYEILVDAGYIGPDYVPGHAHSDIFSFILRIDGQEIITDTGTSTYENNDRRNQERSTSAHNTVMVEGKEQNEVWSAFRVGRRGKVTLLEDRKDEIIAYHDGYNYMNVTHKRHFKFGDQEIVIRDYLNGRDSNIWAKFYVHFHPGINIEQTENRLKGNSFIITFSEHASIVLSEYKKAMGYNIRKPGIKAEISFKNNLETTIRIVQS